VLWVLGLLVPALGSAVAADGPERSKGQTLYVPAYSQIAYGERQLKLNLAVKLSVRNVDLKHPITIQAVEYHGSDGKLVRSYLEHPRPLAPLATTEFHVSERDRSGGTSTGFIVRWKSDAAAVPALVEAVMISTAGAQGISFVTRGRVIEDAGD
jgi:hypothetical protein